MNQNHLYYPYTIGQFLLFVNLVSLFDDANIRLNLYYANFFFT